MFFACFSSLKIVNILQKQLINVVEHELIPRRRLSILSEWQGLRDQELSDKSGIPGCIFVHANGFIGGNQTYEGVLEMARKSLKQQT